MANDIHIRIAQDIREGQRRANNNGVMFNLSNAFKRAVNVVPVSATMDSFKEELDAYLQEQLNFVSAILGRLIH